MNPCQQLGSGGGTQWYYVIYLGWCLTWCMHSFISTSTSSPRKYTSTYHLLAVHHTDHSITVYTIAVLMKSDDRQALGEWVTGAGDLKMHVTGMGLYWKEPDRTTTNVTWLTMVKLGSRRRLITKMIALSSCCRDPSLDNSECKLKLKCPVWTTTSLDKESSLKRFKIEHVGPGLRLLMIKHM